ncbi:MAG: TerB family tellurite resistance protein [Deltaproteobacteria bacterium]|nr:TerB family tellurite resistance protein [Deltaproteobacteria bacterium]
MVSRDDADLLEKEAEEGIRKSVDLWQFANLINEHYSIEEKLDVIELLWRIVFVDGKMNRYEDYLMHKLTKLLRLSDTQLIDAKLKVMPKKGD